MSLIDALQQLNLEPGTYRCELPEQEIVVQVLPRKAREGTPNSEEQSKSKIADPETIDESCILLDPGVELPGLSGGITSQSHLGEPEPPDIPDIPPYAEGDDYGMLDPWVELPSPKPIGTVIARFALPSPPDIPEIPNEDDVP